MGVGRGSKPGEKETKLKVTLKCGKQERNILKFHTLNFNLCFAVAAFVCFSL